MGKVKQMHIQQLEDDFALDLSYQEWLMENFSEPSGSEINEMEQDYIIQPYYRANQIISEKALNNHNYDPNTDKGA